MNVSPNVDCVHIERPQLLTQDKLVEHRNKYNLFVCFGILRIVSCQKIVGRNQQRQLLQHN